MTKLEAHPVADLFPMLSNEDLAELAADIAEHGLLHPIVVLDGRVLDGRNRLAACEIAGVEPTFVEYDGDDPSGYALSVNIARRHLTKSQQAMIAARASSVSGNHSTQREVATRLDLSQDRVKRAFVVLDHAPDLVDAVIAGATGLDEAYRVARERKTAADSVEAQLARLRAEDPELADKVVEGELSLAGAWAERRERERKRAEKQRDARALLVRIIDLLAPASRSDGFVAEWADQLGENDPELTELIKRAADAQAVLGDLIERTGR